VTVVETMALTVAPREGKNMDEMRVNAGESTASGRGMCERGMDVHKEREENRCMRMLIYTSEPVP